MNQINRIALVASLATPDCDRDGGRKKHCIRDPMRGYDCDAYELRTYLFFICYLEAAYKVLLFVLFSHTRIMFYRFTYYGRFQILPQLFCATSNILRHSSDAIEKSRQCVVRNYLSLLTIM